MKGFIYGVIYLLVGIFIFGIILNKTGSNISTNSLVGGITFLSKDGGNSWSQIQSDNKKISIRGENIIFSNGDSSHLFLASAQGIFKVENGKIIAKEENQATPYKVLKFIQNPNNQNIVYLIVDEKSSQKVLISYDKGKNFQTIFISGNEDEITVFKIDPIVDSTLYIGTKLGLFLISSDSGKSWQKKYDFSPQAIKSFAVRPTDKAIFLSIGNAPFDLSYLINPPTELSSSQVFISKNEGNNFVQLNEMTELPEILQIEADSLGGVYFISANKVFFSQNSQFESFPLLSPSIDNKIGTFTIDPKNPNILYIGAENILYKTNNRGESWETLEIPTKAFIKNIRIDPQNPDIIILSAG